LVELSVQELLVKVLLASLLLKLTVPVGVDFVPASVSLTVAVQLPATPAVSAPQLTPVLVERLATVTLAVPLLVACAASPP
jgi:hypothetical protein